MDPDLVTTTAPRRPAYGRVGRKGAAPYGAAPPQPTSPNGAGAATGSIPPCTALLLEPSL